MNLAAVLPRNRLKTAISRTDYSRPIKTALADGLIGPTATVFDYGRGLGDDIRYLGLHGVRSWDGTLDTGGMASSPRPRSSTLATSST